MREIGQPLLLLRSDVGGGGNAIRGVHKEEHQELAVARLPAIGELEGLDLVLVEVWEGDAAIGSGDHVPDFLHTRHAPGRMSVE